MEFEDCLNSDEKNVCKQLLRSLTNFEPYPHERMIRLALSPPIFVSLNLTIQHGPCAISCEGGDLNSCNVTKEDHFWLDASSPYYFTNCTPSHNYCVAASIGECCPVCTSTVFMTDSHQEYYHEDRWQWNSELIIIIVLIIILFSLGFVIVLKNYFNKGLKSRRQQSQDIINNPLTQHILEVDEINQPRIKVVCLYLRENNPLFIDMVNSVLEFLRRKGINVIDLYEEEENINRSVGKWVKTVIKEENTKILLFDSVNTRKLWNGIMDGKNILKPLEQVIYFTRSSIPVINVHNYLFVVSFYNDWFDDHLSQDLLEPKVDRNPRIEPLLLHTFKEALDKNYPVLGLRLGCSLSQQPLEKYLRYSRSYSAYEEIDFDTKTIIDLSDGRCYVYPIHRERLANDLKT